jgi:glycosyltransferase involved in cell wall biosynthesis
MLAIVIPYYKYTFFEATLISLKNQTDKRFNVYVGNDASTENPERLLEKYIDSFKLKYKKFERNLGNESLVEQWERCINMIQHEKWLVILGDDDVLEENFVEQFYSHLNEVNKHNINVIRYATRVINEHNEHVSKVYTHPKIEKSTDFLMRKLKGGTRSSLSEFVFKSQVLKEIKFKNLPLAWYSDYLAVLECTYFGEMYTINDAIVYFRLSGLNITSQKTNLTLKNVATFNFYYYLLEKKNHFFNKEQKEKLYFMLEKTFLDNKKNIKFWWQLTVMYMVHLKIIGYLRFLTKVTRAILKKYR